MNNGFYMYAIISAVNQANYHLKGAVSWALPSMCNAAASRDVLMVLPMW